MKDTEYFYLATHYSNHPEGMEAAYKMALDQMEILMKAGVPIYCHIVHNHVVGSRGFPTTHDYWMMIDKPLLAKAKGVIIVTTPGWEASRGIGHEIDYAHKHAKLKIYMEPGVVPEQFKTPGELDCRT